MSIDINRVAQDACGECEKCGMPLAEEHTCPYKGMFVDDLLKLYPKELFVKKPTVFRSAGPDSLGVPTLIVIYHYDGIDIKLEHASSKDKEYPMTVYAVQEITHV